MQSAVATNRRNWLLWIWNVAVIVTTWWIFVSAGMAHSRDDPIEFIIIYLMMPALFTGLGTVISAKRPGNRIAWLFLAMGLSILLSVWADLNVAWTPPAEPSVIDALAVVWFDAGFQVGVFIPLALLMHIFPTGSFLSPRWVWARWAAAAAAFVSLFAEISVTEVSPNFPPDVESWTIPNPLGFMETGTMGHPVYAGVLALTFLPLVFGGVASIILRYRRSGAIVKAQIRWVVLALLVFVLIGLVPAVAGYYGPNLVVGFLFILVSVTVAITRYRLFDIDRLISRTVGYAIVIVTLGLVFALIAVVPGLIIGGVDSDGTVREAPPILVAASTLAVAALFNPLRRQVLRRVDRRFNRSRYDAEAVIDGVASRIGDEAQVEDITEEAVSVVMETMEPSSVGVWVRES